MEALTALQMRGIVHDDSAPLLAIDGLFARYSPGRGDGILGVGGPGNEHFALKDITFHVEAGDSVAVVGPNGAGKSTLFKVIAGTLPVERGTVRVYGHEPDQHICIAYVPQRTQIDLSFPVTAKDVVMMGRIGQIGLFRRPRRHDWNVVRDSLERVNAAHLGDRQIGELSGGQQQRVFIARALAQRAELLLLDEPFTGLDAPSHDALYSVLDRLHADGVTMMVATHDLNLAAEHFDLVMLLNREIVAYGKPDAVVTPEVLVRAYGGHVHVVGEGAMVVTDTCCDGEEERLD